MIVEDEPDLVQIYKTLLPKDWTIDFFDNARDASAHYTAKSDYDLVITDIQMAHKSGEGLIYDIDYINPSQKIIVVSGHISELNLEGLRSSANVKVFQKPWDIRNVSDVLNNWHTDKT